MGPRRQSRPPAHRGDPLIVGEDLPAGEAATQCGVALWRQAPSDTPGWVASLAERPGEDPPAGTHTFSAGDAIQHRLRRLSPPPRPGAGPATIAATDLR